MHRRSQWKFDQQTHTYSSKREILLYFVLDQVGRVEVQRGGSTVIVASLSSSQL
jgi:hypothetical protein